MINKFYCTKCGNEGIPIFRKGNQRREKVHLKKLYCLNCQQETNHAEIANGYTYNDFLKEFKEGNFNEEGKRVVPFRSLI